MTMAKKFIEAKVRPLANPSLEKASLLGAARVYISKEALLGLTSALDVGRPCIIETTGGGLRREAALWLLPDKNVGPNIVMMTRAFQEAAGFKMGDLVRVSLGEAMVVPVAREVVVRDVSDEQQRRDAGVGSKQSAAAAWQYCLSLALDRADYIFPGMLFEGVNMAKFRRSFIVLSVDRRNDNLAKFQPSSTDVSIIQDEEPASPDASSPIRGPLVVTDVPGLASQVEALNRFLRGFCRPFWIKGERQSCGFVIHGGRGTGKTMLLQRVEQTGWGSVFWIRPSDKLSAVKETFLQARSRQPSVVLIDGLEDLVAKDRANRESVIETLGDELDSLSLEASREDALPRVVVLATCLDYMTDVPEKLQKRCRFRNNVALPIPRAAERLEILRYLDPPLDPDIKETCLAKVASMTHAYNGDDLAELVLNAKVILGDRLDKLPTVEPANLLLTADDMDRAFRITRPTAMHDINLKPPTIHWKDVGGQGSLKKVLSRMIRSAKDANPASKYVLRNPPKGLLLYGPPGCSKTLSAQAMATESGFNFFAVKGAELLNMYVGESERAVRTLFERARAASPSIIFFDEIDSIGGQRGPGVPGSNAGRSTGSVNMLTTLLTEMDGFEALTGVLVLAATNRPEAIDPALLRPGRFDQVLYVGPPDQAAREDVFSVHLRGLSLASDVDVCDLARRAEGYSGAEIRAVCNEAGVMVLDRLEDLEDEGGGGPCIGMGDLVAALGRTRRNITGEMIRGYEDWGRQFCVGA
ncbi:AAA family ATPase [Ophiocordyceps camponoti-floridani]|uniref:AAA family ATPase n=1 Tax=Ophiocordyceps camponoti-floridani TaxID=2030778 RepID=A0A8H4QB43_9HYPO|nr:AAA family ATPase [Ophiocordyceps camponoti-floridani]